LLDHVEHTHANLHMEHSPGSALVDRTRGRAVARRSPSALPALPRRADPGSIGSVNIPVSDGPVQLAVRSGRAGRGGAEGKAALRLAAGLPTGWDDALPGGRAPARVERPSARVGCSVCLQCGAR
jgi:hypothetical protein